MTSMNRRVDQYIIELGSGLVGLGEVIEYLEMDEKLQVRVCKEVGLDPLLTLCHALRLSCDLSANYPGFKNTSMEIICRKYLKMKDYNGNNAEAIRNLSAYYIKRHE
jgi:hypothetical protein